MAAAPDVDVDALPQKLGAFLKSSPLFQAIIERGEPDPDPPPRCAACRDLGFLRADVAPGDPRFGVPIVCECKRPSLVAARLARFWAKSQAPSEYRDCTLESYPGDPTAVPALRQWLLSDRWLILEGGYGAGKTGLTVALLRVLAEQGRSVLFVNAPAMLRRVRATYGKADAESESAVIDSLAEVDVLAIDDIGKERLTEWATELLYDVTNRRYSEGRRTLVTTNLRVDALETHLGSATFWRLFERSRLVHVEGNLRRRKGA